MWLIITISFQFFLQKKNIYIFPIKQKQNFTELLSMEPEMNLGVKLIIFKKQKQNLFKPEILLTNPIQL